MAQSDLSYLKLRRKKVDKKRAWLLSVYMKKILLTCAFLYFLSSCAEDKVQKNEPTEDSDDESSLSIQSPQTDLEADYDFKDEILARPQLEAIEVSQTKITLNWFDPSNWTALSENPSQIRYTLENSTDPKIGNLVSTKEFSQTHQVELEGFQADTSYYFRLTAHPPEGDARYLPSPPSLLTVHTLADSNAYMGGLIVQPELGKVNFKWGALEQPGPINYVLHLLDDPNAPTPFEEIVTRDTEIRGFALQGGRDYWLQFSAMPAEEPLFVATPPISQQFHVPANQLDQTQNPTAIERENKLILEWSPVENATGPFAYAVKVTCGPQLDQFYGEYLETDNKLEIVQGKEYGRFYFEIKAVPLGGNTSDLPSNANVLSFDYPIVSCPSPMTKAINRKASEPGSVFISLNELPQAPAGHRYEIEIASDAEFVTGLDRRLLQSNELETQMTGRLPEENHYFRIRLIGPPNDVTVLPSAWTDTVVIEAQPVPPPPPGVIP